MPVQLSLGKVLGGLGAFLGVAASAVAIWQYIESKPGYDISGEWTIENTFNQTSYKPFEGLRETYKVTFTQSGTQFSGVGEKWADNGKELVGPAHTPVRINGNVDRSGQIQAAFTSKGSLRETSGGFIWRVSSDPKRWTGTFESTAADSSGTSVLSR